MEEQTQNLECLKRQVIACQKCPLSKGRHNAVFGTGPADARIMVIGEGPGENEDLQGVPFVGQAGRMLDNLLRRAGLKREDLYITNVVKCRPPGNRDPEPDEVHACWPFLMAQVEIIHPKVIVALGKHATQRMSTRFGSMGDLLACSDLQYGGIPVVAAYHPSYLLRAAQGSSEHARNLLLAAIDRFIKAGILAGAS